LTTLKNYAYLQQQGAALIEAIQNKITFFKKTLPIALHPYHIPSDSPIQTIQIKGNDQVVYVATQLQRLGFDIRPIRSPTVAVGTERLRICLHLHNTEEQISNLIHALSDLTN
jgi:8-amino-7-oxononanoate synthase